MPHKDFEVPEAGPDDDPITFTLAGEKFECLPVLPVTTTMMMSGAGVYKRQFPSYIRACLVERDEARYDATLADKGRPVTDAVIEGVFWYLMDCYAERTGERLIDRPKE